MKLSTQITLGFLIAICIDLLDASVNYSLTLKVNQNSSFLATSEQVIRNSTNLNKSIIDMQNALRGYLLTGNERYLSRYDAGLVNIPILVRQEKQLISSSPQQQRELDSIELLHNLWIKDANVITRAKGKGLKNRALAGVYTQILKSQLKNRNGYSFNDDVDRIFRDFNQYEYRVREARREALADSIHQTEVSSITFSSLLILIGMGMAMFLVRKISRRIDSMVVLAENISNGDFTPVYDKQKDEMSSLSVSLNGMSAKLSRNIRDLEKKNNELDQFAYVVSHDLKAPIRGIYNVLHWIDEDLESEISPKMREYLDIIPERMRRMESLIDGLLDYARVGNETPVREEVDVDALIGEIADMVVTEQCRLIRKNLPVLTTEKLLLQQVFSNLISNAVKYSPPQNCEITVSGVAHKTFYEFTVSDNGPGIEAEYHNKIFDIFQTLREKNDKESTGVGLAIVKKIIDDKHGAIKVQSSPGNGASFVFTWPFD